MLRVIFLWSLLLLWGNISINGQISQLAFHKESSLRKHAENYFEKQAYSHAAKLYHKIITEHPDDSQVQLRLGDCYRLMREPGNAAYWYGQALRLDRSSHEHFLHYASVLCAIRKYHRAKLWYAAYLKRYPDDQRAKSALKSLHNPVQLFDSRFEVMPLNIALPGDVFSPAIHGEGLVFVGEGNTGGLSKSVTTWQESPYFDLYYIPIKKDGQPGYPRYLDDQLNSTFHEGPVAFFDNGNKVIITRSNSNKGEKDTRNLQLMLAERKPSGEWSRPKKLFHHPDYSVGHPSINSDGTVIYFVSNKPGGYGGTDLYSTELKKGVWQEPVNAGSEINTAGDELFPSMDANGMLFFSSDGHGGLGGLEIFKVDLENLKKPRNVGHPINSEADDFGIVWIPGANSGYFSTNRTGQDRIYRFIKNR
ncbi:MAG: hypothetical protein ACR2MT_06935 [Aurantibacter sp.]